jgi:hypothetical protein
MTRFNNRGSINILLIPLILTIVLFLASAGFGFWAYASRQDYKNNVDQKITTAVEVAKQETTTEKENEFIEREKRPLKEYAGPGAYGSVKVKYPKTWSAYVDETSGNQPLDAYFHPNFVPGVRSDASYALRLQVVNNTFDEEVNQFDSDVRQGKTKAKAYKPVNVDGAVGLRLDGEIGSRKTGTLILIKLRDKTLKIWTEADQFKKDFQENVLENLTFSL